MAIRILSAAIPSPQPSPQGEGAECDGRGYWRQSGKKPIDEFATEKNLHGPRVSVSDFHLPLPRGEGWGEGRA
jgi:hypothetical protein